MTPRDANHVIQESSQLPAPTRPWRDLIDDRGLQSKSEHRCEPLDIIGRE